MFYDSINIFTDANKYNIGFGVYDSGEKKVLKKKCVNEEKHYSDDEDKIMSVNELDAIRYAAKYAAEKFPGEDITFYTDNINAQKLIDSFLHKTCTVPDLGRLNVNKTKDIWSKINKHFDKLGTVRICYSPSHCKSVKEFKSKFKIYNSESTKEEVKSWNKKDKKHFYVKLMKRNAKVDLFIKKED